MTEKLKHRKGTCKNYRTSSKDLLMCTDVGEKSQVNGKDQILNKVIEENFPKLVLLIKCKVINPETIYTQTTRMDPSDCIYMSVHIYTYLYGWNNNKKRRQAIKLKLEGLRWAGWKPEGGKERRKNDMILFLN